MNTRRYPRTLNEAFPKTPDYACAIERDRRFYDETSAGHRFVTRLCAVGLVAVVWCISLGWL